MTGLYPFCVPGKHASQDSMDNSTSALPEGWALVRASFENGEWVEDPTSLAKVVCCPEHRPKKENA